MQLVLTYEETTYPICKWCGEILQDGVLLEWNRGKTRELYCQKHYDMLVENKKAVTVIARVSSVSVGIMRPYKELRDRLSKVEQVMKDHPDPRGIPDGFIKGVRNGLLWSMNKIDVTGKLI